MLVGGRATQNVGASGHSISVVLYIAFLVCILFQFRCGLSVVSVVEEHEAVHKFVEGIRGTGFGGFRGYQFCVFGHPACGAKANKVNTSGVEEHETVHKFVERIRGTGFGSFRGYFVFSFIQLVALRVNKANTSQQRFRGTASGVAECINPIASLPSMARLWYCSSG